MWNQDIEISLVVHSLIEELERFNKKILKDRTLLNENRIFDKSINQLKKTFSSISDEEVFKIIQIACGVYNAKESDGVEIVVTTPSNFKIKARKTVAVINELINSAQKDIMITGYSISDYVDELLNLIIKKSRSGIYVDLYINDIKNKEIQLKDLLMYKGRFLKIYNYQKQDDKMAALHAKTIVVDCKKTFITSSNLSYHGIMGNIEMGVLITSESKSKIIKDIFQQLRKQGILKKV